MSQISTKFLRTTTIYVLLFHILLTGSAYSQDVKDTLTLEACITTVLDKNISLITSREQLESAAARIQQARAALYPSFTLFASDNTSLNESGQFSQYDPTTGQSFVPGEGFQVGANVSYTLYDSSRNKSILQTEHHNRDVQLLDIKQLKTNLIQETIQSYLSILERNAELTVRKEQISKAQEALRIVEHRLSSGKGIHYEVLLEEAYLAQSKADLLAAENGLEQANRALLILMHQSPDSPVNIAEFSQTQQLKYSTHELLEIAKKNRLEFSRKEMEISLQKLQLKILKSAGKPKVDFFMSYNQQGADINSISEGDSVWSAGISLRFSPFPNSSIAGSSERQWINSDQFMQKSNLSLSLNDGSSTRSQEIDARIAIQRLGRELEDLERQVWNEVLNAYQTYSESLIQLDAKNKNLLAMTENHRIQTKSFELGINQFKDVIDARTDLVSARIELSRSRYTTEKLKINLEYFLGLLEYQESL